MSRTLWRSGRIVPAAVGAAVGGVLVGVLAWGPLSPPAGPVGSTAKTLGEVEPRIAVNATNTPGNAGAVCVISQPGSYYLTGGVSVPSNKAGIKVTAWDVTVDLNGFAVKGEAGAVNSKGIDAADVANTVVHSGSVAGLTTGVQVGARSQVRDVRAASNSSYGVVLGDRSTARDCECDENGLFGILTGNACVIERCRSYGNATGFGFGGASLLRDCLANGNSNESFEELGAFGGCELTRCTASYCANGSGIIVFSNGIVTDCVATNNALDGFAPAGFGSVFRRCTAVANGNYGYNFGGRSNTVLEECTARGNVWAGAYLESRSTVRRCTFDGNGTGLTVGGFGNLIEGCSAHSNTTGYSISFIGNKLARNTASANTTNNWSVVSGNSCYVASVPTSNAITGSSGGTAAPVTDPDANYSY